MADEPAKPLEAPVREQGYAHASPSTAWDMIAEETTPELQWPQNLRVYDKMRRTDPQVQAMLRAVTLPIVRTPWRIQPNGASPEVVQFVAQDLGLPIVGAPDGETMPRTRDRFSWAKHLRMALLSLSYGHMVFEQVYRIEWVGDRPYARLRKLGPRMPLTISGWDVAADGGLNSIIQAPRGNQRERSLPVSRLVVYVNEQEGGNWTGQSLLRSAYKNWILKDRALRVDAMSLDRNGIGLPIYEGAPDEKDLNPGKKLAASIRAGNDSGAAIPHGAKLALKGVEGQLPDGLARIRYHDQQISSAVLAHFLNLGQSRGTGSWALGSTFADFFTMSLGAVADDAQDVANAHIVEDLVDLNFGEGTPAPRIVHDPIGSRSSEIVAALQLLVNAGIITPDQPLETFMRTALDLPAAEDSPATTDDGEES